MILSSKLFTHYTSKLNKSLYVLVSGLALLAANNGYSMGQQPAFAESFLDRALNLGLHEGNRRYKSMGDAVTQGLFSSVAKTLNTTSANTLSAVPEGVKKLNSMLAAYIYKVAYGSRALTWNSLALMNNRICKLVGPFTQVSLGNFTKKKRALFIEQEEDKDASVKVDEYWLVLQKSIIKELEHIRLNLRNVLPCYSLSHYNLMYQNGFKNKIVNVIHALSLIDNAQVAYYVASNMEYISHMIDFFKATQTLEDVQQNHEELKRWLSWVHESFEHIARLLEADNTEKPRPGKLAFVKPNGQQTQNSMPSLNDLLPGGANLNSLLNG